MSALSFWFSHLNSANYKKVQSFVNTTFRVEVSETYLNMIITEKSNLNRQKRQRQRITDFPETILEKG